MQCRRHRLKPSCLRVSKGYDGMMVVAVTILRRIRSSEDSGGPPSKVRI